jgi:O-antigen/teichoic acid export membrane protein
MHSGAATLPRATTSTAGLPGWLRRVGRAPWAFADQALISGTNFFTMILLARQLPRREFGDFALVYAGLLLANSLQAGPITTAHNVLGATRRGRDYIDYTTSTALAQLGFALAAALLMAVAAIAAWGAGAGREVAPLLALLAPTVFAWQLQEFSRRVLYTERRLAAAFGNDLISYGGQATGIAALWATGTLSAPRALITLAARSALAAAFGSWQLRESLRGRFDRSFLRENWAFGKWLVGVNLVESWLSNAVYFFLCGFLIDAAAAGLLKASHTILGPTRVLSYVLSSLLPIHLSRTLGERGDRALDAALIKTFRYVIPLLGGYCLLVALCAGPVLGLFYRDAYPDGRPVLVLYCVLTFLVFVNMTIDAALLAKHLSPLIFSNQLRASLVILPFGWLAVRSFGAHGAVLSMIATNLVLSVLSWRIYRRSLAAVAEVAPGDTGADDSGPTPRGSPGREDAS